MHLSFWLNVECSPRCDDENEANGASTFISVRGSAVVDPMHTCIHTHVVGPSSGRFFLVCRRLLATHAIRRYLNLEIRCVRTCVVCSAERTKACGCTNKSRTKNLLWFMKNFVLLSCGEFFVCRFRFAIFVGTADTSNDVATTDAMMPVHVERVPTRHVLLLFMARHFIISHMNNCSINHQVDYFWQSH